MRHAGWRAPRRYRARGLRKWRQKENLLAEHELVAGHFLHGLWSRPVDLTAYPVILGVGVNAEFDGVVGGS